MAGTGPTKSPPPAAIPNNAFKILLTNLRLLDLDNYKNVPLSTIDAFEGKDTIGKQKCRVQFVEWVLYQLCQIWDAEQCKKV